MRYSVEPRDQIYVKSHGFLSFAKSLGNNLSSKYGQNLLDTTKKSAINAFKIASKGANQKLADKIGNLVGNEVAEKITKPVSKSTREDPRKWTASQIDETSVQPIGILKEKNISPKIKNSGSKLLMNFNYYDYLSLMN